MKFLNKIKKFKLYLMKFYKDNIMKNKICLFNYIINNKNCQLIMIIIYNKYIFLINNNICKAQIKVRNTFYILKI